MKEAEIRPQDIFDEYLRLAQQDTETYFRDAKRTACNCPACEEKGEHAFKKNGFDYALCNACNTLFVSPRPEAEAFTRYYAESPSSKFWATTFYKETAEARREKLWKPKAAQIADILKFQSALNHNVIDIGGGYGIFAEEMSKLIGRPITVIEPSPHLAEACRQKGLDVVESFLEQVTPNVLPVSAKLFVSFELFEHLHSPIDFLTRLNILMQPGDLFIFTTLSGLGIDILTLWERSKSVSPPHHLNFFNPHSVRILLERLDFNVLAVTTPGQLDVDLLCEHASVTNRFWQRFKAIATEKDKQQWQKMIAGTGWSSHMMVVCRKG